MTTTDDRVSTGLDHPKRGLDHPKHRRGQLGPGPGAALDLERWPDLTPPTPSLSTKVRARIASGIFHQAVRRLPVRIHLNDGRTIGGGKDGCPEMYLQHPDAFFARVGAHGLIGFGESYMAGDWDSPDVAAVLTELCREIATLVPQWMQKLRALYVFRQPESDTNTVQQTRGNVARHYDLSNDLFAAFLDETLSYSSALFAGDPAAAGWSDLAAAQERKIDRLLDQAQVGEGTRVLEIGTGWGELAIRAAARGANVHSVTLSSEQQALAQERIAAAGYADRVTVVLCDYRLVDGEYDAVLSVEMIEAVGHEFWPTYFKKIDEVLAPQGIAAIQAITMPHDRMLATRQTWTWINKYIFPGGFLPSTEAIADVTRDHTTLRVNRRLSMGRHYARTLRLWDEQFQSAHDRITELGFDPTFERMWHLYLAYSEAGFAAGYIDVQQITFTRPVTEAR
ncbi:MAG: class SAM-dependent methyltransferase [Marmoricola sp.]|nr:class SAM-dependent methyltransferase [Marmoricola sp.]